MDGLELGSQRESCGTAWTTERYEVLNRVMIDYTIQSPRCMNKYADEDKDCWKNTDHHG